MRASDLSLGQQFRVHLREVKVVDGVLAGLDLLLDDDLLDRFAAALVLAHGREGDLGVAGRVLAGRGAVGQHDGVLAVLVLEEVRDALFLHQPRDEVEVRLAVLHDVLALLVARAQAALGLLHPVVGQDLLDQVRIAIFWKIRQLLARVRNHICGTIVSRYCASAPQYPVCVTRDTNPLK